MVSMATQEEIRSKVESHKERIEEFRGEIEIEKISIRVWQNKCKHPNKYQYSCMGELSWHCPDCEWGT